MMDETSVLTMLARRGAAASKAEPQPHGDLGGPLMTQLMELAACRKECEDYKAAALSLAETYQRKCEEHKREMDAKQAEMDGLTQECADYKAKCSVLESRPAEVHYREAEPDESLRAENADLMVRCATLEGRCSELERTVTILRERPIEIEREEIETSEPQHEAVPLNYDIDVVRGGDDRIRTLRVRVTD